MYERLGDVKLKSGAVMEAGVVTCPDADWADRVCRLLGHKGDYWEWHITKATREALEAETRFYLLHQSGEPMANIMTVERNGVGVFGHVYTAPAARRQGAASGLMAMQMAEFQRRGGQALHLGTEFDSAAYHIYAGFGFRSVEPRAGIMAWYATDENTFERKWFGDVKASVASAVVEPFEWRHWPRSSPLLLTNCAGMVRLAGMGVMRRTSSESAGLKLLRAGAQRAERGLPPNAVALTHPDTGVVIGLANWSMDKTWPLTMTLDVWCHPQAWDAAPRLIAALPAPSDEFHQNAYGDVTCPARIAALEAAGFRVTATLPGHVPADAARSSWIDALVLNREG